MDGIIRLMDEIRARTGLDLDGENLVNNAFSLQQPRLIFSELETDSGRNDQKGFMEILKGSYKGIRNPKAHSLANDLNQEKAGQYLVFFSLLMRRVKESRVPDGASTS